MFILVTTVELPPCAFSHSFFSSSNITGQVSSYELTTRSNNAEREREREFICPDNRTIIRHNEKYNGRLPEGVSTPSMLATSVNITNNIDNERKTEESKASKNKQSMTVPSHTSITNVNKPIKQES